MKITRSLADHTPSSHPVLTIGNFDGQHLGHLALLRAVVKTASVTRGTPLVLTFDPHPLTVLSPGVELRLLTTNEEKLERFQEAGIHEVLALPFDRTFASLNPEEFVMQILRDGIGVRELLVGENFAFGKGRAGRLADLVRLGETAGFRVHPVQPVSVGGLVVSSSRIRSLVQAGDVGEAARCLGRPYALSGMVVRGEQRGQALGWPTANLRLPQGRVIPADGVYATITGWKGQAFDSVTYIGTRPTFGQGERLLEVSLLDQRLDLYGEEVVVRFVERLRGDLKCESAEELSTHIERDVALARDILRTNSQARAEV
jgi:riboflavin kinase/FMN adenylyltransferase